ncbi:DNA modification methylase [Saccharopolyspora sp. NPDC050389]|uniref:DNA modification methylase n=1 Tax=Saccharopolyspora sp. NPDC050389 TaxID=3155516 RepID=UPI0033CCD19B
MVQQIITTYTSPGDTVCDPNPGSGLLLAEVVRAGRKALGLLPTQVQWESFLEANLARLTGSVGTAALLDSADDPRAAELPGAIDFVLTDLRHTPECDPSQVLVDLYEDLDAVADWVWPGAHIVVTCRPWRRRGHLLDLHSEIHDVADAIGLIHENRAHPRIVTRTGTSPERTDIHGHLTSHPAHLDVLVVRLPATCSAVFPNDDGRRRWRAA